MKSGLDHAKVLLEKADNDVKTAEIGAGTWCSDRYYRFSFAAGRGKTLKALLAFLLIVYPKTHDLDDLFDLLPAEVVGVLSFRERLIGWTSYAVDMRYDITGYPDREEMRQALQTAQDLRAAVLAVIQQQSNPQEPPKE